MNLRLNGLTYTLQYVGDYFPYGRVLRQHVIDQEKYISQGNEREYASELDYFNARFYDADLGRFNGVDPLSDIAPGWTPYRAFLGNPILLIDPTGLFESPIYDEDTGELLGTDNEGLQGDAIVMKKNDFVQGMDHDEAVAKGSSLQYVFESGCVSGEIFDKILESYKSLPSRPDYDGKLTLDEANKWYRDKSGSPLYVDAAKIDLSPVKKSDFDEVGSSMYKNFFFSINTETGLVYGTIKLTLVDSKGVVKLGNTKTGLLDNYGFEQQEGRFFRNVGTWIGQKNAGDGKPFNIFSYGTGKVK